MMEFGGLLGLVVFVLDIWAIISIVQSTAGTGVKVLWVVLVLLLPVFGLLLWFLFGPKGR
ncbi:PLDc N-terminal domain-containing protein [Prosthecochloris sp. GSB1]|uniref:PLDc N-terminal domain-containing protein n=1 Tax=Prosthecochloris sp. GSB1 TaxID=281093 RepID=UPI001C2C2741|nr:PLDc N-terminal domain-containing protein [Prosthecochloris sp. GSB1]